MTKRLVQKTMMREPVTRILIDLDCILLKLLSRLNLYLYHPEAKLEVNQFYHTIYPILIEYFRKRRLYLYYDSVQKRKRSRI